MTPQERIEEAHGLWEIAITRALALAQAERMESRPSDLLSGRVQDAIAEEREAFATWQKVATEALRPNAIDDTIRQLVSPAKIAAKFDLSLDEKRCDLIQRLVDGLESIGGQKSFDLQAIAAEAGFAPGQKPRATAPNNTGAQS